MSDRFYRSFEERYYASREAIRELRKQYLPFIYPLAALYPGSSTFDAGCGRGEWLELMIEHGFQPIGVDLDEGMLEACLELSLPASKGDAIEQISLLERESQAVVSAFHVVEHVSFEQLRIFVREAMQALKPGGLLIMETPNPENIAVSTCRFYIDPTHKRPIPPELLSFIAEYEGFDRVKILRLQQSITIDGLQSIGITDVVNGVSPDYAVIAQKRADAVPPHCFIDLFDKEYGLSLNSLMQNFDERLARIEQTSLEGIELSKLASKKAGESEDRAIHAEARATQLAIQLQSVYKSNSWKVTAPLRRLSSLKHILSARHIHSYLKESGKFFVLRFVIFSSKHPRFKSLLAKIARYIRIDERLRNLIRNTSSHSNPNISQSTLFVRSSEVRSVHLDKRGRRVYMDLKNQIYKGRKI